MVLGVIIPGIALGVMGAVWSLFLGYGVIWSILAYILGGVLGIVLTAGLLVLRGGAKPEQTAYSNPPSVPIGPASPTRIQ